MKNKYKQPKDTKQYMFGSLINQGVTGIAGALGANDKTAQMIGSGVATATGFIPGMQGNLTQGTDLIGDIGSAAGDKSGMTRQLGNLAGMAAPLMMANGGMLNSYADGGLLTKYENGGSHEMNPNGGIPIGGNASVEEGETRDKDFIFSDRLKINKKLASEFNLPNKAIGKTFAEVSKMFEDSTRPNDKISKNGYDREVGNLKQAQEAFKQVEGIDQPQPQQMPNQMQQQMQQQMAMGGRMQYFPGGPLNSFDQNQGGYGNSTMQANENMPFDYNNEVQKPLNAFGTQSGSSPQEQPGTVQALPQQGQTRQPATQVNTQAKGMNPNVATNAQQSTQGPMQPNVMGTPYNPNQTSGKAGPLLPNGDFVSDPNRAKTDVSTTAYGDSTGGEGSYASLLRYAPAVTEGINLARTMANKPTAKDPSMFNTNQSFNPNLIDMNQVSRNVESQGEANRKNIRSATGGNQAAMMGNLVGSQLQTDNAIANANIGVQGANNQEYARVEGLNYDQNMRNQRSEMQVTDMNDRDLASWNNQLMDSTSNMGQNLGNIGSDFMNQEMAKNMPIEYYQNLMGGTNYKKGKKK